MTRLVVLGDYSGRNTGHNAHLLSVCHELRRHIDNCELLVPTLSPGPIRALCNGFADIKPFGVAPWHGSLKFFGPPVLAALKHSRALILADNMFYDNHLYHPLKNNLVALRWLVPAARRRNIPVVYFNAGVGPARSARGRALIQRLAAQMDAITLRDAESATLFEQLTGIAGSPVTADSGFNMPWQLLTGDRPSDTDSDLLAVNLSRHLGQWLDAAAAPAEQIAASLEALAETGDRRLIFIVAHPGDRPATERVTAHIRERPFEIWQEDGGLVRRIADNMQRFGCAIGTRYHEIVMFASAGVAVLGLDCGEKLDGLFATLQCPGNLLSTAALAEPQGPDYLNDAAARAAAELERFTARVRQLAAQGRSGAASVQQLLAG